MNKNFSSLNSETDWDRLEKMSDDDIDFSDIPPLTDEQLKSMKPFKEVMAKRGIEYDPRDPYTIVEHHDDGTTTTHEQEPDSIRIVLEPELRPYFLSAEAVIKALRMLIDLMPAANDTSPDVVQNQVQEQMATYKTATKETPKSKPQIPGLVALPPDVYRYFYDSEQVNQILRSLIALIPKPE